MSFTFQLHLDSITFIISLIHFISFHDFIHYTLFYAQYISLNIAIWFSFHIISYYFFITSFRLFHYISGLSSGLPFSLSASLSWLSYSFIIFQLPVIMFLLSAYFWYLTLRFHFFFHFIFHFFARFSARHFISSFHFRAFIFINAIFISFRHSYFHSRASFLFMHFFHFFHFIRYFSLLLSPYFFQLHFRLWYFRTPLALSLSLPPRYFISFSLSFLSFFSLISMSYLSHIFIAHISLLHISASEYWASFIGGYFRHELDHWAFFISLGQIYFFDISILTSRFHAISRHRRQSPLSAILIFLFITPFSPSQRRDFRHDDRFSFPRLRAFTDYHF